MNTHRIQVICGLIAMALPGLALADPCEADVTRLQAGQVITGTVRYVGDGDSICLGSTADPASWIEIRLENWFAPELHDPGGAQAKASMASVAEGRAATCVVRRGRNGRSYSYDRVFATCSIGGRDLAALLQRAGGRQGGRGYP